MKNDKKQNHTNKNRISDFDALNSQLGSFDLEPPKIYRETNQRRSRQPKESNIKNNKKRRKKTTQYSSSPNRSQQYRRNGNSARTPHNEEFKHRKKKNLKLKIIRVAAVILAVLVILIVLSLTVIFKIDKITVTGNTKYSNDEILSVLPIEKEKNLFLTDTKAAEEKLQESLPYIFDVQVKKKFPTTITVQVTETPQLYSIKNQDRSYTLLDENLKVLETNTAKLPKGAIKIEKLSVISANPGQKLEIEKEQQIKDITNITAAISKLKLDKITAVSSYDISSNTMTYENRIVIRFGTTENLEDKIYASLTAIEKLNETNPGAKGDLTVLDDKQVYFTEK